MQRVLLLFLFLSFSLILHAPEHEIIPEWHYASFDVQNGKVITKNGIYVINNSSRTFLVYERKRRFGYEILLKEFKSIYYKRQR